MRHRILTLTVVALATLSACTSEEDDGRNTKPSVCQTAGPCEQTLLHQCGCCPAEQIEACRSVKQTLCATGNLQVELSIAECEAWNRVFDATTDACLDVEKEPGYLDQLCVQFQYPADVTEPDGGSLCEPNGPCEQTLLNECGCCPAEVVEVCRSAKRDLCATGELMVGLSVQQCEETNATFAAVEDGCTLIPAAALDDICPPSGSGTDTTEPTDTAGDAADSQSGE